METIKALIGDDEKLIDIKGGDVERVIVYCVTEDEGVKRHTYDNVDEFLDECRNLTLYNYCQYEHTAYVHCYYFEKQEG